MVVPVSVLFGLPESCPVLVLKAAQAGAFWMLKVIFPPSESDAAGVKLYWEPTLVPVEGVPVMLTVGVVWFAVGGPEALSELIVVAAPPPQAARINAAAVAAHRALISLNGISLIGLGERQADRSPKAGTVQSHSPLVTVQGMYRSKIYCYFLIT
jgi:hypothetical protein